MAKYSGVFSCGHEGIVNITGPHKDREWKKENAFSKRCPECYEKYKENERARQNEEALKKAKEMELPELKGTDKQIAWANTIRQQVVNRLEKELEFFKQVEVLEETKNNVVTSFTKGVEMHFFYDVQEFYNKIHENYRDTFKLEKFKEVAKDYIKTLDYIVCNEESAKFYIDNARRFEYLVIKMKDVYLNKMTSFDENADLIEDIEKELDKDCTIYPESFEGRPVVKVEIDFKTIKLIVEKNEEFRLLVKKNNYKWVDYSWQRTLKSGDDNVKDRVAEIVSILLNAKFPVRVEDNEIREKAVSGEFDKEITRWIELKGDKFLVVWDKKEDLYDVIKSLPSSKYEKPNITIEKERYQELEDFAQVYDFTFNIEAEVLLKKMKDLNRVKVTEIEEKEVGLESILNSSEDILEHLIEEEELKKVSPEETLKFMKKNHFRKKQMAFNAKGEFFGWYEEGNLVAVVSTISNKNTVRIKGFMVDEGWQGRGIGTKVLEKIMTEKKKYTAFVTEKSYPLFKKLNFTEESINRYNVRFMTKEVK